MTGFRYYYLSFAAADGLLRAISLMIFIIAITYFYLMLSRRFQYGLRTTANVENFVAAASTVHFHTMPYYIARLLAMQL